MILEVPPLRSCVASARHWVLDRAGEAGVADETLAVVELLTSEIMTNAVVHGTTGSCVRLTTRAEPGVFEVSVTDDGPGVPTVCHVAPVAEGGRGLLLVDALATAWGIAEHDPGKSVWFRMEHPVL